MTARIRRTAILKCSSNCSTCLPAAIKSARLFRVRMLPSSTASLPRRSISGRRLLTVRRDSSKSTCVQRAIRTASAFSIRVRRFFPRRMRFRRKTRRSSAAFRRRICYDDDGQQFVYQKRGDAADGKLQHQRQRRDRRQSRHRHDHAASAVGCRRKRRSKSFLQRFG